MTFETINRWRCFDGWQTVYAHPSEATGCRMEVAVYTPPQAETQACPVVYYLSGLTCTWENAVTKAGAQRYAADHGLILVFPDTSPRGDAVADAPDRYDLGKGAGFYLDATQDPWAEHYRMDDYVVRELPAVLEPVLPTADGRRSILGHSMGGHGALVLAMRNPDLYQAVSAFAPIVAPSQVDWGRKALTAYLGDDPTAWAAYDASALVRSRGWKADILVDQGEADAFLTSGLRPELFEAACAEAGVPLTLRRHVGYDHSYYFIASFMADHLRWHAERLRR